MPIIAFDFETHPIRPGLQHPPAVCMSYAVIEHGPSGYQLGERDVVTADVGIKYLHGWLSAGCGLVGANLAFDVLVSVNSAPNPTEMFALWVTAYQQGNVADVLLNQKLIDLACTYRRPKYSLASVVERHHPTLRLDKKDKQTKEIRVSYYKLDGMPVSEYPQAYYDYSLEDSVATAYAWIGQQQKRAEGSPYFPGADILHNAPEQCKTALAIRDLESTGMLTDRRTVELFRDWLHEQRDAIRSQLIPSGLIRREVKRNRDAVLDRIEDLGIEERFLNKRREISVKKAELLKSGDYLLQQYAEFPDCDVDALIAAGLATESFVRDQETIQARVVSTWPEEAQKIWQSGCLGKENLERLHTLGCRVTDNLTVQTDGDALTFSGDPLLKKLGKYNKLLKTISTDLSLALKHIDVPLHPHYDTMKENGRLGSSPNVQNMPRAPGVREMWCAPPGWDIGEADYSSVELRTFAQICYDVLGFSRVGDMLNDGTDLHLMIAASYFQVSYQDSVEQYKVGDAAMDRGRTMGKGVQYGAKGGLGVGRMVDYFWQNYELVVTEDDAKRLLQAHKDVCTEYPAYVQWIKSMARDPGQYGSRYDIVQPWSGRLRNGCGYCDANNSPFSGLAADLLGVASWRLMLACYGLSELGQADPLYGCKPWLSVHDSLAVLAPSSRSHAAAVRLGEVMQGAGRDLLPSCPPEAEPCISRQLSKLAKPRRNEAGELVAWDAWEEIQKLDLATMRKKRWPEYMIRATLGSAYEPPKETDSDRSS